MGNRFFFLFLRVLRCFSSPRSLLYTYRFSAGYRPITTGGFPHSDICGSPDICSSPQLFAACHVLLRRPVPRHPPCALSCLTFLVNSLCEFAFSLSGFSRCKIIAPTSCSPSGPSSWFSLSISLSIFFVSYSVFRVRSLSLTLPYKSLASFALRTECCTFGFQTTRFALWEFLAQTLSYESLASLALRTECCGGLGRTRTSDLTLIRRAL